MTAAPRIPLHRLDIDALTDAIADPTEAVQYCVIEGGIRHIYGDQDDAFGAECERLRALGHTDVEIDELTKGMP